MPLLVLGEHLGEPSAASIACGQVPVRRTVFAQQAIGILDGLPQTQFCLPSHGQWPGCLQ